MITASDDDAEMNGLKLFGAEGAQLTTVQLEEVVKEAKQINSPADIAQKENCCLIRFVPEEYEDKFIDMAAGISYNLNQCEDRLRIVYSPLYGNGTDFIPAMLDKAGFKNVFQVAEQSEADVNFSTIQGKPSPENRNAFRLSAELAKKENADIIILSDPDCDKLRIACKNEQNEFEILASNEVAVLLWDFLLSQKSSKIQDSYLLKSVTATPLLNKLAAYNGAKCVETAPKFSSVIGALNAQEEIGEKSFIAAADLNMSLLCTDAIKDKDAVTTIAVMAALANKLKNQKINLQDKLDEIYNLHGYYYEDSFKIDLAGGYEFTAERLFGRITEQPPKIFGYVKAEYMDNFTSGEKITFKTNRIEQFSSVEANLISIGINKGRIFFISFASP